MPTTTILSEAVVVADRPSARSSVPIEFLEEDALINAEAGNGTFLAEMTPATTQETIRDLETSVQSLVITARQLGAYEEAALRGSLTVWQRL